MAQGLSSTEFVLYLYYFCMFLLVKLARMDTPMINV